MPKFSHRLPEADWCRGLRTLADVVRGGRSCDGLFPVDDGRLVQAAVRRARTLSHAGRLSSLDRFFALVCLIRQRRDEAPYLAIELSDAAFEAAPYLERASHEDVVLMSACIDELRRRGGDFDRRLVHLRREAEQRSRLAALRQEAERSRAAELERLAREAARREAVGRLKAAARAFQACVPDMLVPVHDLAVSSADLRQAIEWSPPEAYRRLAAMFRESEGDPARFTAACWNTDAADAEDRARRSPPADGELSRALRHLNRNLSARIAEHAVGWVFRNRARLQVGDVSGEQGIELLREPIAPAKSWRPVAGAWKDHDLAVRLRGGRTVKLDVKNARTSYVRGRWDEVRSAAERWSYREHYVPAFKKDRGSEGSDILIAGVLSPAASTPKLLHRVPKPELLGDDEEPIRFLGTVGRSRIRRLQTYFAVSGVLELHLNARSGADGAGRDNVFVPPWMFSVPAPLYGPARRALKAVREAFGREAAQLPGPEAELWPLYIAAGMDDVLPAWVEALPGPWGGFAREMSRLARRPGLSLPVVYLGILRHFLLTLRSEHAAGFTPATYGELLFGSAWHLAPAGVPDPAGTVQGLIGSLELLMSANLDELRRFTTFRFAQTGVLKGVQAGASRWKTLLFPYCGGPGCGRRNLALGKDGARNCPTCGYLVCTGCGFCRCRANPRQGVEE